MWGLFEKLGWFSIHHEAPSAATPQPKQPSLFYLKGMVREPHHPEGNRRAEIAEFEYFKFQNPLLRYRLMTILAGLAMFGTAPADENVTANDNDLSGMGLKAADMLDVSFPERLEEERKAKTR